MNVTMVRGHRVTREAVSAFLRRTDDPPPLRNASFYVVRDDGRPVGAKAVIYAVTDGADHWGNEAAQALLRLGFPVRVRRRAKTHSKPPYAAFADAGLLLFDDEAPPGPEPDPDAEDDEFDPEALEDTRSKVLKSGHARAGQPTFRRALLDAYGGRCAISGSAVKVVLEAAHIAPHRGVETNRIDNGILLRADLHLLFDAGKLGIDPDTLTVVLDKSLARTAYRRFAGKAIRLPADPRHAPSVKALRFRRKRIGPNA